MKISHISTDTIKTFCKIDSKDDDELLPIFKTAAINYIKKYTGYKLVFDECEEFAFAYLVLINEMSNNRSATVTEDKINKLLEGILSMNCMNLL
ncbi:phage gp6-like head-tail connector protein [Clostridium gasigenes]|uniref:head-tail connector protein n=1 Tax=Clostridium gasigenes TaxID=94869 RepID=UPI0016268888|nr:head-tail connector protein [Clostridium gasigenes]MBB6622565.1 phage gp6-like head-tail connector protein [Clostridium gasigenes]